MSQMHEWTYSAFGDFINALSVPALSVPALSVPALSVPKLETELFKSFSVYFFTSISH